jgi:arsenite-transporting ATPase
MPRIILFTGKGGVGKTTVAAATAIKTAELGYRTLVISADPAHSLSDSFQVKINPFPTGIEKNLHAIEINVEYEIERQWDAIINYLKVFFSSQGIDEVVAEELAIMPGFDELVSLLHVLQHYESGKYDVIILDCAPTGETLRLLNFPEVARWYMNRFFGIERKLLKVVKPIAKPIIEAPLPSDDFLDAVQDLYVRVAKLKDILEGDETTIRIVMNPEKMVLKESERAFAYLNLFGYRVDCLIVNKVFPENSGEFLSKWVRIQQDYLKEIKERFPLPVFIIPFKETEIVGEKLHELAKELYNGRDPTEIFYKDKPLKITKEGEETVVSLKVPFVSKDELKLLKRGEELIIIANQWKRIIFLPQSLATKEPLGARFINGELKIRFGVKK